MTEFSCVGLRFIRDLLKTHRKVFGDVSNMISMHLPESSHSCQALPLNSFVKWNVIACHGARMEHRGCLHSGFNQSMTFGFNYKHVLLTISLALHNHVSIKIMLYIKSMIWFSGKEVLFTSRHGYKFVKVCLLWCNGCQKWISPSLGDPSFL